MNYPVYEYTDYMHCVSYSLILSAPTSTVTNILAPSSLNVFVKFEISSWLLNLAMVLILQFAPSGFFASCLETYTMKHITCLAYDFSSLIMYVCTYNHIWESHCPSLWPWSITTKCAVSYFSNLNFFPFKLETCLSIKLAETYLVPVMNSLLL